MAKADFTCLHCGAVFQRYPSKMVVSKKIFCSMPCHDQYRRANCPPPVKHPPLTQQRLKDCLHYNPEDGLFTWVKPTHARIKPGTLAAPSLYLGYRRIKIDRRYFHAHRLAFLYMHGEWPKGDVDHINGVRDDNRWANLRDVPRHMNLQNRTRANSTSISGLLGVGSYKNGTYLSQIKARGVTHYLGIFKTAEEAHAVYMEAKSRLHAGYIDQDTLAPTT